MANPNNAYGLALVDHLSGADLNHVIHEYAVPASDGTALFRNQLVTHGGTMTASETGKMVPVVVAAASAGTSLVGVIIGFKPDFNNVPDRKNRVASTLRTVMVADDPYCLFSAQEDSVGGALAATNCGNNAAFIAAAGSTTTGLDGGMIDSSTAVTSTANLRLYDLVHDGVNAIGVNAQWIVFINEHLYKATAGL